MTFSPRAAHDRRHADGRGPGYVAARFGNDAQPARQFCESGTNRRAEAPDVGDLLRVLDRESTADIESVEHT